MVMILEAVPQSLRGELSRWMIEPRAGVFVGKVPAVVRDRLWQKALKSLKDGSVVQIWGSNTEQGYSMRSQGDSSRVPVDFEGLTLIKTIK